MAKTIKTTTPLKYALPLDMVNRLDDAITDIIPSLTGFTKGFYASDVHKNLVPKLGKTGGPELTYSLLQKRVDEGHLTYDKENNTFRLWTLPMDTKPKAEKPTEIVIETPMRKRDIEYINRRLDILNTVAVARVRKMLEGFMLGMDSEE